MKLRQPQDPLSNLIEKQRTGTPRLAEVSHRRGVVHTDRHCGAPQRRLGMEEPSFHSEKFPSVDGNAHLVGRPKAGNHLPDPSEPPSPRPRRRTKSRGPGRPGRETPLDGDKVRLTTRGGRGDKRESKEPELNPPPDPNSGGVGTEATSCEASLPVQDG